MRNVRRAIVPMPAHGLAFPQIRGGGFHGEPYPRIGAAAAQIARHRAIDVFVGRFAIDAQQGSRRHDLAGLAVAALRNLMFDPRRLHGVHRLRRPQPLDRGDVAADIADLQRAGPHRLAIDMHGAGATHRDPAAIFRAGDAKLVAQDPKQGHVGLDIQPVGLAVDLQFHATSKSGLDRRLDPISYLPIAPEPASWRARACCDRFVIGANMASPYAWTTISIPSPGLS